MSQKKQLGQYFTISEELQQFVFDKVKYKGAPLLEPSFGAGHLLKKFKELDSNYPMTCYELDSKIKPVVSFNAHQTIVYGDFTKQKIGTKFKTIVGNPPYVKQKGGANLYIKFIELCYELLDTDGELLFIVPSDFIKLTSAAEILTRMTENGSFTDFLFPNNEKLFEGASIDVLVFRYQKGLTSKTVIVDGKEKFCSVVKGIVTFRDAEQAGISLESLFHVYVGLVSGRDEIYRVGFGNIDLLCDKERVEKYIFPEVFPTKNAQIDAHLEANKAALLERKIRKFSEANWFEWGAPRNLTSIRAHWGKPCIYVRNMTRKSDVAFLGSVQYFGGTLLCLVPKAQMTAAALEKTVQHLNSEAFQKDYIYSGRFKIGHKQISTALLPPM
jgi:adenine-specific DNA-methyltransferase